MYDRVTLKLNVDPLILSALREDITSEDVSANSIMKKPQAGEVDLSASRMGLSAACRSLNVYLPF